MTDLDGLADAALAHLRAVLRKYAHELTTEREKSAALSEEVEQLQAHVRAWGEHAMEKQAEVERLRAEHRVMEQVIDDAHAELDYLAPGTNGLEDGLLERLVSIRER